MKATIHGAGYVGLVTGACLAEVGHHILCLDTDAARVRHLRAGEVPFFEPGLEPIVKRNLAEGRLRFTDDVAEAVRHAPLQFIAVGTPPGEDGSADLRHVLDVAAAIGRHMQAPAVVVTKSTVPVGTADAVREAVRAALKARGSALEVEVVSNPEFLKEGAAVGDFLKPDRIVVGCESESARALMHELYEPFNRNHDRMMFMDLRSAELTKYAANAMLATRISFMNEIAGLAERVGADVEEVRRAIGADPRIGWHFIYPGCGYGGSCFPKDVRALERTGAQAQFEMPLLRAVEAVNERQKHWLFTQLAARFGGAAGLRGRTIAVWGLAFKPNTDDMREASSRVLVDSLLAAGAQVQAFDPVAGEVAGALYAQQAGSFTLCGGPYEALEGADALAICTEWQQFRSPDFERMRAALRQPLIVDGRNLYDPRRLRSQGWTYIAVGRP